MAKRSRDEHETSLIPHQQQPSKKQKLSHTNGVDMDLLDLIDDAEEIEELTANSLRSLMIELNTAITKNEQQRSKYNDNPLKFRDSEVALNDIIQELALKLPENPTLFQHFVAMKGVDYLLKLLVHENLDIASSLIGFIKELTESDNYLENESAVVFIVAFIKKNGIKTLLSNLKRLNDANIRLVLYIFIFCI